VLSVGEKRDACFYKEQYTGANQQNTTNCFYLLRGKPISVLCVGDIPSGKQTVPIYRHVHFNANIGGEQSMAL
jgi:hypothetical protein